MISTFAPSKKKSSIARYCSFFMPINDPMKKVCKKSANCGIMKKTQEADFLWQEEKEKE